MLGSINKVFADCSTQALYLILDNNCAFLLVGGFLHDHVVGKTGKKISAQNKRKKSVFFSPIIKPLSFLAYYSSSHTQLHCKNV